MAEYEFTPTLAVATYTALDTFGSNNPFELTSSVKRDNRFVIIQSIVVTDKGAQAPGLNLYFFKIDPTTGSTFTDEATMVIGANAWANCVGHRVINNSDYMTPDGNHRINTDAAVGIELPTSASGTLWMVAQCIGTPAVAAADDIIIRVGVGPSA